MLVMLMEKLLEKMARMMSSAYKVIDNMVQPLLMGHAEQMANIQEHHQGK